MLVDTLAQELAHIDPANRYPIYITHTKPSETELIMEEIRRLDGGRYPYKQAYLAMSDDGVRVRRFFEVVADLLKTADRMQRLEERKVAYEEEVKQMAGQPLKERLRTVFRTAARIGKPMEVRR